MENINGMIRFAKDWAEFYKSEISTKLDEVHGNETDEQRNAQRNERLALKSYHKAITNIETGFFFVSAAMSATLNNTGKFSSASFVDAELEEMQGDVLSGVALTAEERKKIKQRIQSKHLALMNALSHFGLFEIEKQKGALSNDVNYYVITNKGRETLSHLKGENL